MRVGHELKHVLPVQEEGRRAGDALAPSDRRFGQRGFLLRAAAQARVELRAVKAHRVGDLPEPVGTERPHLFPVLVRVEVVVVGPELALVGGTAGRGGRIDRLGPSTARVVDNHVPVDEVDLPGGDIVLDDQSFDRRGEVAAVRALEVAPQLDRDGCPVPAERPWIRRVHQRRVGRDRGRRHDRPRLAAEPARGERDDTQTDHDRGDRHEHERRAPGRRRGGGFGCGEAGITTGGRLAGCGPAGSAGRERLAAGRAARFVRHASHGLRSVDAASGYPFGRQDASSVGDARGGPRRRARGGRPSSGGTGRGRGHGYRAGPPRTGRPEPGQRTRPYREVASPDGRSTGVAPAATHEAQRPRKITCASSTRAPGRSGARHGRVPPTHGTSTIAPHDRQTR